jgi:hypothetical protein
MEVGSSGKPHAAFRVVKGRIMKKLLAISLACSLVALAVGCFVVTPPPEEAAPAATTPAPAEPAPAETTPAPTSTGPSLAVPRIYGDGDAGATD